MTGARLGIRNARVQRLRRLAGRRRARDAEGVFVIDGQTLVAEALRAGVQLEGVYVSPAAGDDVIEALEAAGVPVHRLAEGVIERVADTTTPQPVVAVATRPTVALSDVRGAGFVVVLVDVRDPGNAGTVIRSAEAAGAGAVVCCDDAVDVFAPKCVRASAGSLFHVPVVTGGDPVEVLGRLGDWGLQRLGAVASGGSPYDTVDLTVPTALVLGNEAHGLPREVARLLDGEITVPIAGRAESLNVAMAASVLCFEAARQRRGGRGGGAS